MGFGAAAPREMGRKAFSLRPKDGLAFVLVVRVSTDSNEATIGLSIGSLF